MKPDPVETRMEQLTRATADVRAPAGLDARVVARLASHRTAGLEPLWAVAQRAVGLAFCAAAVATALALWHDARLTEVVTRSPDAGLDLEPVDP